MQFKKLLLISLCINQNFFAQQNKPNKPFKDIYNQLSSSEPISYGNASAKIVAARFNQQLEEARRKQEEINNPKQAKNNSCPKNTIVRLIPGMPGYNKQ